MLISTIQQSAFLKQDIFFQIKGILVCEFIINFSFRLSLIVNFLIKENSMRPNLADILGLYPINNRGLTDLEIDESEELLIFQEQQQLEEWK